LNAGIQCTVTLTDFTGLVKPPEATFKPTREFTSIDAARAVLDPQLHAWRTSARLANGGDLVPFEFVMAEYEQSAASRNGSYVLVPRTVQASLTGSVVSLWTTNSVPDPPTDFVCDEVVDVGVALYEDAAEMPEHALKFGYAFH